MPQLVCVLWITCTAEDHSAAIFNLFIFSNHFPGPEPIPKTLNVRLEYTLDEKLVNYKHIHSHLGAL